MGSLEGSEGVIRILKSGISVKDLSEKVISLTYEDDPWR